LINTVYYSPQQLQKMIAQLDQAIYNHEQWYKGLLRTLIARLPPESSDLQSDAHHRCRFGQWYYSDETKSLRDHLAFASLGKAHEQMHNNATHLLRLIADNLAITPTKIDSFHNMLDRMVLEMQSLHRELADAVQNRDPLTGARNRVGMLSDLREQHALVRRGVQQCAIIIVDVDHFKGVNDRYGHPAGDTVLTAISHCLEASVRPYDRIYRYGGEEFLLYMPNTTMDVAVGLAERLRAAVASKEIPDTSGGPVLHVTASFGVAPLDADRSVEESIDEADKALYQAKSRGRNRVEIAP
jgi:diguanylate cyclase (GGDEF)-like protein